jgi:hypothetical protein
MITASLVAQVTPQTASELPQLTLEQKVDRAVMNSVSYMVMGISYAKSVGKSVENYAAYCADLAKPSYQRLKDGTPMDVLRTLYGVLQTDKFFRIEILNSSKTSVSARMKLYGIRYIDPENPFGGVTVGECYRFYNTFMDGFTKSVGFTYAYDVEADWIVYTLSKNE